MEQTEINRLREICEKEGFRINEINNGISQFFQIDKKDEWEGVEFAECIKHDDNDCRLTLGKIYKLTKPFNNEYPFPVSILENSGNPNSWKKKYFQPSTEQAYKEQLIKEVKIRFGEIIEGDRFDLSNLGLSSNCDISLSYDIRNDYYYDKYNDQLYLIGFLLYKQGKWAKKITEPEIKVEYTGWEYQGRLDSAVNIGFKVPNNFVMSIRLGELMAEFIKNHIENEKTS